MSNSITLELYPQYARRDSKLFVTISVHLADGKRCTLLMGPCLQLHLLCVYMIGSLPKSQGLPINAA